MKNVKRFQEFEKINELFDDNQNKKLPTKSGWYWVLIDGYDEPTPCWFSYDSDPSDCYFLPGGMGDSSSSGLYNKDINKVGPEIEVPNF